MRPTTEKHKSELRKQWYAKNRDKIIAKVKLWAKNNRERANQNKRRWERKHPNHNYKLKRMSALKIEYGITLLEYDNLYQVQSGCCAICKIHQSVYKKTFHVDHNHETGKIRGLLCFSCNFRVGRVEARKCRFHDNWILFANEYLKKEFI